MRRLLRPPVVAVVLVSPVVPVGLVLLVLLVLPVGPVVTFVAVAGCGVGCVTYGLRGSTAVDPCFWIQ